MARSFAARGAAATPDAGALAGTPGRRSLTQEHASRVDDDARRAEHTILDAAWAGIGDAGGRLPHLDAIQASFGHHDVSGITAHVGGAAREASAALGARAYATGDHVAFAEAPDLFLAAHEAAHVVQQRAGIQPADVHEEHADAVAARVVAGQSAAALLDATPRGGGASGAVQRFADRAAAPPKPAAPGAADLGKGVLPQLEAAMKAIDAIDKVWDAIKPEGGVTAKIPIPPAISPTNAKMLDRVLVHRVATRYLEAVMQIGARHGIDFRTWRNGRPPQPPASADPAAPAMPAEANPFLAELQTLVVQDLRHQAEAELNTELAAREIKLPRLGWFWNGADMKGFADPTDFDAFGGDYDTWGRISWRFDICGLPDFTPLGIPAEAAHFGLRANPGLTHQLYWSIGGSCTIDKHTDWGDDLDVSHVTTNFRAGICPPIGGQRMEFLFEWDDADTHAICDVSFSPYVPMILVEVDTSGTPET
jgi:hypothetical protein